MHICMVLWKSFPRDIRVEKEARALQAAGHDVTVLCRAAGDRPLHDEVDGIDVHRVDEVSLSPAYRAMETVRYLLTTEHTIWAERLQSLHDVNPIDVIHVHDLPLVATGNAVGERLGIPTVADLHENYPEALRQWRRMYDWQQVLTSKSLLAEYTLRPIRRYKRIEERCIREVDHVLTPCEEGRRHYLEDCGASPDRVTVVGNTVDRSHFDVGADPVTGLDDEFVISYIGKYAPHRGLEAVVEGFASVRDRLPESRLLIVGAPGGEAYGEQFDQLVDEAGVRDAVTFTGWVDFERVPNYIATSDVCLVPHADTPHTNTTIPHKLFQYMAMGKPVLVSDVPPLKRVVTEADAGIVARAGMSESFADAIVKLSENSDLRDRLGTNGQSAVDEQYAWERDAKRLKRVYEGL